MPAAVVTDSYSIPVAASSLLTSPSTTPWRQGGTVASGINAAGQIVGYYQDASSHHHGFLLSSAGYTTIDGPSATGNTFLEGINGSGQIVGNYSNATGNHAF